MLQNFENSIFILVLNSISIIKLWMLFVSEGFIDERISYIFK